MKHVTVADKNLLLGDRTADLLVDYAKVMGQENTADTVELHAISSDGDEVVATFLLNSGVTMVIETTSSTLPEPDNHNANEYIQGEIVRIEEARTLDPAGIAGASVFNTGPE